MSAEIKAVTARDICDINNICSISGEVLHGITDVVFDLHLLVDWDARRTLAEDYPDFIGEVLFSFEPEWGFEFHESLREAGWSCGQVLDSFDEHHGPAVTWLYRLYFERFERGFAGERADTSAVARELIASGVRVWALGNASSDWLCCARKTCPILGELNGVCVSYESHLRKPDVMLYRTFLQQAGLSDTSTLFLEGDSRAASAASLLYS
ncbi:HAD family hydrolase [Gardnerella sp. 2492-Sm]|uniref:HAD family hydrolase n=1 Tax=unclassified Gardnerella TaxID=2628112 RepID=UPI003CFBE30D